MWILIIYLAGQQFVHQSDHNGRLRDTTFKSAERCVEFAKVTVPDSLTYSCARR